MLNNDLPHAGSEILSPKVRDVIFNNEILKSEVTKIRNFIFNNEITSSGVTKVRNFISMMTCPNQVMKSGRPNGPWTWDTGQKQAQT